MLMARTLASMHTIFFIRRVTGFCASTKNHKTGLRLLGSSTSIVETGVSRLGTLQTLLQKHGAPGSTGCNQGDGDIVPLSAPAQETPELLRSMGGNPPDNSLLDLHPYLLPIARSTSTNNWICAYRRPLYEEESSSQGAVSPWPIVESRVGSPGMKLLALNSEHLMRRIVSEIDAEGNDDGLIDLYNEGLGKGLLENAALDTPYEKGSVGKLGYGVDKYVLLRVGPFPDLYRKMSKDHLKRGDEQSALIAAEAANAKLAGFGSMYSSYARMLKQLPSRDEEARDAARMCLRLPLSTIGMEFEDFREVAVLGQLVDETSSVDDAMIKICEMCSKLKEVDEKDPQKAEKSQIQVVFEEADRLMSDAIFKKQQWGTIRPALGTLFRSAGCNDLASFIDLDQ